jgi:lipopolysaccharide/colanic/teichoic acid biosynthesis glycosyltransferase
LTFWQRLVKRGMDIVISSLALLLSLPLLVLTALAIKLQDGGPVFFRQERVGEGGNRFTMLKLRSMVPDAEAHLVEVLERSPHMGAAFKIPDDPRVTAVGRVLRRWSLDEIPQLWNVLRGDLSLVGPRPEEALVVDQYDEQQRARLGVPQGLSGPMQVSGRGMLDIEARLELEMDYIENYSLWKDIVILLRTIPAVIRGKGAL